MRAVYYRAADGSEPVDEFIETLDVRRQVVLDNQIDRLHAFQKNTAQVPESEKRIARARWQDFKSRMDAPRRRPPRAAGHDAPG